MLVSNLPPSRTIKHALLELLSDGREYSVKDIYHKLANHFSLTQRDLDERYPTSKQRIFYQRCSWARQHLKEDSLIESPRRGYWCLS